MQINPPFDASAPCPACQHEVRAISATVHNFLTRCARDGSGIEHGKAMVKLFDLRQALFPANLTVPHPAAEEVVAVGRALVEATEGMTQDGLTIRWTPEILAKVEALIPRAMAAEDAFDALSEAHFADERHSSIDPNILRASRGSKWAGFVKPDYDAARYDYAVEETSIDPDIVHTVCGAGLALHDHFKANLSKDPTFYGLVWCPRCRGNVPFAQFDRSPVGGESKAAA